ncbi:MAG: hypothetical protein OEZ02_05410, partial [Anaerolineae bacterium]|nr:hypothetical protein [Anaerolineae bacterium]
MQKVLLSIAKRFWPQLETMPLDRQVVGVGEVIAFLYAAPMAVAGLAWLVLVTDWAVLKQNAAFLLLLFVLNGIFYRLRFFLIVELRTNRYGSADGSMAGIVLWSAIFILGPVALWLSVVWFFVQVLVNSRGVMSVADIWNRRRNLVMSTAGETLVPLTALWLYREWGGEFGFADLSMETMLPAFEAIVVYVLLSALLWAGYFGYNSWIHKSLDESNRLGPLVNFFLLSIGLPQLALPFAILAASLYIQNGLPVYVFFMGGMLVVAFLTRRLSLAVESGRQQFRVLEKLEQLGRAIIMASPTPEALPEILRAHIPNMFPSGKIVIWIFPDNILFKSRQDWHPELDVLWPWLLGQTSPTALLAEDLLPWQETAGLHNPVIVAPIVDVEGGQPFAGVLLELHTLAQPWDRRALNNLMPAVKSLTDQIASAIHQSEMAEQTLEFERVTQELRLAGSIQSSLLPYVFPEIPGWELAVSLSPAGEMAGDFFDIIPLQDG